MSLVESQLVLSLKHVFKKNICLKTTTHTHTHTHTHTYKRERERENVDMFMR